MDGARGDYRAAQRRSGYRNSSITLLCRRGAAGRINSIPILTAPLLPRGIHSSTTENDPIYEG